MRSVPPRARIRSRRNLFRACWRRCRIGSCPWPADPPVQAGGHPARFHEASNANAALAITSGLAESVPVLNVPFSGGDMVVLTNHQGFMAHKLGITCGAVPWHDHLLEFGGIFGTGFFWRQLTRQLVGLTPV